MQNPFETRFTSTAGPGTDYAPVTPDDGADLATVAISLFVETGGAVSFVSQKGQSHKVNLPDYGYLTCGVRQVNATGTTATGIHAIVVT